MAFSNVGILRSGINDKNTANWATWAASTTAVDWLANEGALFELVTDNVTTTDGTSNDHTSVTIGSVSLTKVREHTLGGGAAAAGVTTSLWIGVNDTGATIALGASIAVALAGAAPGSGAKAALSFRFAKGAGTALTVEQSAGLVNSGVDTGSMTLSGLPSREYLMVRAVGGETSTATALTVDTNYVNLSAQANTAGGGAATNVGARHEHRIVTTTSETTDPTSGMGAVDHSSVFAAIYEAATVTYPPAVTMPRYAT